MIDIADWSLTPYEDHRHTVKKDFDEGSSGHVMLATVPDGTHYLVKHTYPHNAANEFVASQIADILDIPVPKTFLLSPDSRLLTNYAVAIEYIAGMADISREQVIKQKPEEAFPLLVFNSLVEQDDNPQFAVADNKLISFDFADCFGINELNMTLFMKLSNSYSLDISVYFKRQYEAALEYFRKSQTNGAMSLENIASTYSLNLDCLYDIRNGFIEKLKAEDTTIIINELGSLFPDAVFNYYRSCIDIICTESL